MTETLKPCPLAEALELTQVHFSSEENAEALRAELAKRGYAITPAPDDVAQIVAALKAVCDEGRFNHNTRCRKWWPQVCAALEELEG